MKTSAKFLTMAALSALVATSACTTDPETGQQRLSKAAIGGLGGAVGGYLLGDLVGGRHDRTEKIIGAGIGGLATAVALGRRGIASHVLERRPAFNEDGAGIQIGPNGTRVLRQLGGVDSVRGLAGLVGDAAEVDEHAATVAELVEDGHGSPSSTGFLAPCTALRRGAPGEVAGRVSSTLQATPAATR